MSKKPTTKSAMLKALAEKTGVAKKDVVAVLDTLTEMIHADLGKKGPGVFTLPGLVKIKLIQKKATPARQGINPATKQPITIAAKPARKVVKAYPVKALKSLGAT